MQWGAALAFLAFAVVVFAANKPMACIEDTMCYERKCGVFLYTNFTYNNFSMPLYDVASGCLFNEKIYWSGFADRLHDLSSRHWHADANGFMCTYHRHMQSILCYCETENCNTVKRRKELVQMFGDRGVTSCIDADKKSIVCGGKCMFALEFVKNEWRIERGCKHDIDAFRHLHGLPLEDYGNGYACTPATSGQILCECSGYHCNSKHQLAFSILLEDYRRRKLQKDGEDTTERARGITLSPSEPIRADPTTPDERARMNSESVPPRSHSHILPTVVAVLALIIAVLVAMCFFSQQILQFFPNLRINSIVKGDQKPSFNSLGMC